MTKHRSHSVEFKRQVAQEFLAGETLHGLAMPGTLAWIDLLPRLCGRAVGRG